MTNEEKAKELALKKFCVYDEEIDNVTSLLMQIAEWKDKQYAEVLAPILIELDELKQQVKSLLP